jgi:serine/threonine-protein kinase
MSDPTGTQSPQRGTIGPDDPARKLSSLWRRGQRPRVADFLAEAGVRDPARIVTVLRVDQWERWRRGERVPAESYLDAFPAVKDDPERAIDVVFAEYLLREQLGEAPTLAEYAGRFPQYADQFQLQLELHQAMEDDAGDAWPETCGEGRADSAANRRTESEAGAESGSGEHPKIPGYEILGVLGWGGMGVVYRAWQTGLGRWVALKMVHAGAQASPQVLARFRVEAAAVARLQHPNIVQVHDVGRHAGAPFLVLELVEGGNLARRVAGAPQPARWAAELAEMLARAIHAAHQQGVVHRDLTPANILLTADGTPKITDFGLAKMLVGGDGLRTVTGELLGTPSYMAPEQAAGRPEAIAATTDVYALGAILYELLAGRPPFKGNSALETLRQVESQEPVAPSRLRGHLPSDLEAIVLNCLRKDPARRYASALALGEDLRRFLDGRPILARPSGAGERAWRWCRRHPWQALNGLTAAAALGLLLVLGLQVGRSIRDRSPTVPPGSSPGPIPGRSGPASPPAAPAVRIVRFDIEHLARHGADEDIARGKLGEQSFAVRPGDDFCLEAELSDPAYSYLIAFRPDGLDEVFQPEDPDTPPRQTRRPRYPPESRPVAVYRLEEGSGLHAFALVVSRAPLPAYRRWKDRNGTPPWPKRASAAPGAVWWSDGRRLRLLTDDQVGGQRAQGATIRGGGPVAELAAWLKGIPGVDGVAIKAFPVPPAPGP